MGTRRHGLIRARKAAGYTQETLAIELGLDTTTVGQWERGKSEPLPYKRPKLARALGVTSRGLDELLAEGAAVVSRPSADYETWADDLDRVAVCLGRQEFDLAKLLLDRWTGRLVPSGDDRGLYLYGRSLRLLGDLRQDRGVLTGPMSARQSYGRAMAVFRELDADRRVAQLELQLAVLDEMGGNHEPAAEQYRQLATDTRLDARDRTRAQLWVGTALSKAGRNADAITFIKPAIRQFEALEEPQDWSVAFQKLALAHRGDGDLSQAGVAFQVALDHRPGDAPMQRVRLDTAHGHLLLSDPATADSGLKLLEGAAATSTQYGMMHQLQAISGIRRAYERQA